MSAPVRAKLLAALLLLCWPGIAQARHVLLVSIDGLAWPHLQRNLPKLPTLSRLWNQGVRGPLQTVFPSLTWPAHTSLVTGVVPGTHGVIGNRFVQRATGQLVETWQVPRPEMLRVPTVYDLLANDHRTTAAVLWPATSNTPTLQWNLPEVYGQAAFTQGASPGLLDELLAANVPTAALSRLGGEEMFLLDSFDRDAAVHLIERHKPDLMLLHFVAVDTLAHSYGPDSRMADWGLELADRYLGDVLAAWTRTGLGADLDVLVVSDHGFLATDRYLDPVELLANVAGRDARKIRTAINGHALFLYAPADLSLDKALAAARKVPDVAQVLGTKELAAWGIDATRDPRHPDAILVARPDIVWGRKGSGPMRTRGMHGYPPELPELLGILIAAGPDLAIAKDAAGMRVVDVAPLLARLLGVTLPANIDGKLHVDLLRKP